MNISAVDRPSRPAGPESRALVGRRAGAALLVVLFGSFMDLLDSTIVVVAAPAIARDLQASASQIQWTLAAYILAIGAGLITGGRVGDARGRKRVFLTGLALFAVASAGCALAPTVEVLIVVRAVQGLAAGFMVPQVFGVIQASFDAKTRASAFGAYGAVQGLAAVAGPLLGGLLVSGDVFGLGWKTIFWINVPVSLIALIVGVRVLPESSSGQRLRLDVVGAVLAAVASVLVLLPLVQGREWGWTWPVFVLLVVGLVAVAGSVVFELRLAAGGGQPVFDPHLLRVRAFSAGLGVSVLFFGAIGAFFLALSVYLQDGLGRTALQTGLVILPYALGSMVTSGLGVRLAATLGRALLIAGAVLLAGSQVWLWLLVRDGGDPGYWLPAASLSLGGLGLGLTAPILVGVVLAGVPGSQAGSAGGALSTVNQIGGAAGIAVLGSLFFAAVTDHDGGSAPHAFGEAFGIVLLCEAGLYLVAAVLALLLPKNTTGLQR